jgi:tRNA U34 5-carboxymethylaminomethyl modifying GTPase MnmE/TrmE
MKMLLKDGDMEGIRELKQRLEENGIPASIQGTDTARMIIPVFLIRPTLWIYIDEQYGDALELIRNPEHIVRNGVDVEEFYKLQQSEPDQRKALNKVLLQVLLFALALMAGMLLVIWYLQGVNT